MKALIILVAVLLVVALIVLSLSIRVVTQYEKGVLFRLGKVVGVKDPGLAVIIPVIDQLMKVSLRIVTMPIQSQGIITRDNVSVDIAAVAYFRVVDAVKSVVVIENVYAAIGQIAQTTLREVVGQHTLDEALAETKVINANIQEILDGGFLIADVGNNEVRKVSSAGVITRVAGTGTKGDSGDDGPATDAELFNPVGVAVIAD